MSLISDAAAAAVRAWLEGQKTLKGASDNTIEAYRRDVLDFVAFMAAHSGAPQGLAALARITVSDMRAWMARTRSDDVGARSLARKLSAVKSFYRWLAEREGFEPTAVLSTRAPKFQRKLPRPLAEDAARAMIDRVELQARQDWVAARDMAVVTLLYGCGLRISEALSLTGADLPLPAVLRIIGKGGKERVVPVIGAARDAVNHYAKLCPHPLTPDQPLFRGVRGGGAEPARDPEGDGTGAAATGPARNRHAPCDAAQLRHPSAERGRRSARDPGIAGPCLAVDHAGLYGGGHRAADGGL